MRSILKVLGSCALILASSGVAAAEGDAKKSVNAEVADGLHKQATAALRKGDVPKAEELLKALWAIEQTARVACDYGQVLVLGEKWPEAARMLASCTRLLKQPVPRVSKLLEDANAKVYRLVVETTPKDAFLTVDGETVSERELFLRPGVHELVVSADGYDAERVLLDGAPGASESRSVTLEVHADPPSAPSAALTASPTSTNEPPTVPPDEPSYTTRNVIVVGAAALAAGAMVGGLVFNGEASSKEDEWNGLGGERACEDTLSATCREATQVAQDWDSARTNRTLFLGLGAGLAVTSVAVFLLWPEPKRDQARWLPGLAVDSRGSSLFVKGKF